MAPADPAVLARVVTGVDRIPAPPASSYLGELGRALREAVLQALLRGSGRLHLSRGAFLAFAGLTALLALLLLARALAPKLHRSRRPEPGVRNEGAPPSAPGLDAAAWRAELERHLAAGRAAEALEAAWWWLARSLAGTRVEPDWTSRDLMVQASRPDLAPLIRGLDRLIYGPRRPAVEDVRRWVSRLEEALV
jgi:hypothetical protein